MMNLANLPDVLFGVKDAREIEANLMRAWESGGGDTLGAADPRRLIFKTIADAIARLDVRADYAAKMNLLAYSRDQFLDHIGALVSTQRLQKAAARCMVKFCLSGALAFPVAIPQGTRVTKRASGVYFQAVQSATIEAGETEILVICECAEAGAAGNGYLAGEIDTLVDPIAYVQSVVNVERSAGGTDIEDNESLRGRIQLAPESFSTAGPAEAYKYHAKSVNADILDVSVDSSEPGTVQLYIILNGGILPNAAILQTITQCLNDRSVRPLTDHILIDAPEIVAYDVAINWYLLSEDLIFKSEIEVKVNQAVQDFVLWQKSKIGRDINQTALIARLKEAGANRVEILSPAYTQIEKNKIAFAKNIKIVYGGVEDE